MKKKLDGNIGFLIIFLLVLAGVFLYCAGLLIHTFSSFKYKEVISDGLMGVGSIISVSGISSAFLKILAMEGYFLDAVSQATFSPNGLSRFGVSSLNEIWLDATRLLFLKDIPAKGKHSSFIHIDDFRAELEEALKLRIPSVEKHFVNKMNKDITVTWHDKNEHVIKIYEVIYSEMVPFNPSEPLVFRARVGSPTFGEIGKYDISEEPPKIVGTNSISVDVKDVPDPNNTQICKEYTLTNSDFYQIVRKRTSIFSIIEDNVWNSFAPSIFRHGEITLTNLAEDLSIEFSHPWAEDPFEVISGKRKITFKEKAILRLKRMMLPGQGYSFVIRRS